MTALENGVFIPRLHHHTGQCVIVQGFYTTFYHLQCLKQYLKRPTTPNRCFHMLSLANPLLPIAIRVGQLQALVLHHYYLIMSLSIPLLVHPILIISLIFIPLCLFVLAPQLCLV